MFLIKSKLESNRYGVLDTSDGVEEFYTAKEIFNIVKSTGIQIQGVSIFENNINIRIYDPRPKLKMLYGSQISFKDNDIIFNKYIGSDIKVEIPYGVTKICDECFYDCKSLKEIVIPDSVTSLGERCFCRCGLQEITIPSSVTSLGDFCFYYCESLDEITIPNFVTSLGDFCFSYCEGLKEISIPDSVMSLGGFCFKSCHNLKEITISNSVTSLGDFCFGYCESLQEITIPNSVTSLCDYCFRGCINLRVIKIPKHTKIGYDCFKDCPSDLEIIRY